MGRHRLVEFGELPVEYRPVVRGERRHNVMSGSSLDCFGNARHPKDRNTIGNCRLLGTFAVARCVQADGLQPLAEFFEFARRHVCTAAGKRALDLLHNLVVFL